MAEETGDVGNCRLVDNRVKIVVVGDINHLRMMSPVRRSGRSMWARNSQLGFTFIEVIMVMAILGTMASITIIASQDSLMDHGKKAALAVEKHVVETAAAAHLQDGGALPVTDHELYRERYIKSRPTLADYVMDAEGNLIQTPK